MAVAGELDLHRASWHSATSIWTRASPDTAGSRPRTRRARGNGCAQVNGTPGVAFAGRDAPGDGTPSRSRSGQTSLRTRQNRQRPRSRGQGGTLHVCPRTLPDAHSVTTQAAGLHRAVHRRQAPAQTRSTVLTSHPCYTHLVAAQNWRIWPFAFGQSIGRPAAPSRRLARCEFMLDHDQSRNVMPDEHADGYMNMRSGPVPAAYSHRQSRTSDRGSVRLWPLRSRGFGASDEVRPEDDLPVIAAMCAEAAALAHTG